MQCSGIIAAPSTSRPWGSREKRVNLGLGRRCSESNLHHEIDCRSGEHARLANIRHDGRI